MNQSILIGGNMSKGDKPRPLSIDREEFESKFDNIFNKDCEKCGKCPPHSKTFDVLHDVIDEWGNIKDLTPEGAEKKIKELEEK